MITSFDILQETFSIDILTALRSSLRKHVLRSLQLYGDQDLSVHPELVLIGIERNKLTTCGVQLRESYSTDNTKL